MKRKILIIVPIAFFICFGFVFLKKNLTFNTENNISELRQKHQYFLDNSPFKETQRLSKKERKAMSLPPNAFNEMLWDRTMDPNLGHPNFKNALKIQHDLIEQRKNEAIAFSSPGQDANNVWVERGPSNFGGRTRAILFDPNDANNTRVFAGGVSGGIWTNNDITDADSSWVLVKDVPENIAVSQFAVDPNNTNIIYASSGESYVQGDVIGNGVYRSLDGGIKWEMIFGGPEGTSAFNGTGTAIFVDGIFYINDIITRNVFGTTEIYIAAVQGLFADGGDPTGVLGDGQRGVYKSIDNGESWTKLIIEDQDNEINPNDLELDINNNIWVASTSTNTGGPSGGRIFMSSDGGDTFDFINNINGAARTEIEPSQQDANVFYIAANIGGADLFITRDAFQTITPLNEPNDADNGIPATDYTRGQAFYDLPIEADPTDENIIYVGGIDLFRGEVFEDNSVSWQQISRWNNGINSNSSVVHADQHAIVFNPSDSNQAVFGTDGGVYFGSDLTIASTSTTTITPRNRGYAVTQFYAGDINEIDGTTVGGTQDNGSPFNLTGDSSNGVEPYYAVIGGDGADGHFDTDGDYCIITTQFINYFFIDTPIAGATDEFGDAAIPTVEANGYNITNIDGGNFINEAVLDANLDILYINAVNNGTNQIGRYSNLESGSATEQIITDPLLSSNISALQVSPHTTSETTLFVGTDSNLLLRIDQADTNAVFNDITGDEFVGSVSDIELGADENTIMVTFSNYGVTSIFYTEDAGVTWVSKEGDLVDIPVYAILQSPFEPNEVIVGTHFGVWRTDNFLDESPNWVPSFNGMSNVPVRDLDLRTSNAEVLATTHGRGMFVGQFIEPYGDLDGDTILNANDNCPDTANIDQLDTDGDNIGDVCDNCPTVSNFDQADFDENGIGNVCEDTDGDTIYDEIDNCPDTSNFDQLDTDTDNIGDVCDNCPNITNTNQSDIDNDGEGDPCDMDIDGDGILNNEDNCPNTANPDQTDTDGNGVGDACDDSDADGINDADDNCPSTANPDQTDTNGNGIGDACDTSYEAPSNISIEVTSESCPGLDNGTVVIETNETYVNYTATITDLESQPLTNNTVTFSDLPVGTYTVCVAVDGRDFESCFEINIQAAEDLDIDFNGVLPSTTSFASTYNFTINQGAAPYEIWFDNNLIKTTNSSIVDVELTGSGLLEIVSSDLCQGIYSKQIDNDINILDIKAFPNPVLNELTITIPSKLSLNNLEVKLFNITGKIVYNANTTVTNSMITLPFNTLSKGIYFVEFTLEGKPVILKILK